MFMTTSSDVYNNLKTFYMFQKHNLAKRVQACVKHMLATN